MKTFLFVFLILGSALADQLDQQNENLAEVGTQSQNPLQVVLNIPFDINKEHQKNLGGVFESSDKLVQQSKNSQFDSANQHTVQFSKSVASQNWNTESRPINKAAEIVQPISTVNPLLESQQNLNSQRPNVESAQNLAAQNLNVAQKPQPPEYHKPNPAVKPDVISLQLVLPERPFTEFFSQKPVAALGLNSESKQEIQVSDSLPVHKQDQPKIDSFSIHIVGSKPSVENRPVNKPEKPNRLPNEVILRYLNFIVSKLNLEGRPPKPNGPPNWFDPERPDFWSFRLWEKFQSWLNEYRDEHHHEHHIPLPILAERFLENDHERRYLEHGEPRKEFRHPFLPQYNEESWIDFLLNKIHAEFVSNRQIEHLPEQRRFEEHEPKPHYDHPFIHRKDPRIVMSLEEGPPEFIPDQPEHHRLPLDLENFDRPLGPELEGPILAKRLFEHKVLGHGRKYDEFPIKERENHWTKRSLERVPPRFDPDLSIPELNLHHGFPSNNLDRPYGPEREDFVLAKRHFDHEMERNVFEHGRPRFYEEHPFVNKEDLWSGKIPPRFVHDRPVPGMNPHDELPWKNMEFNAHSQGPISAKRYFEHKVLGHGRKYDEFPIKERENHWIERSLERIPPRFDLDRPDPGMNLHHGFPPKNLDHPYGPEREDLILAERHFDHEMERNEFGHGRPRFYEEHPFVNKEGLWNGKIPPRFVLDRPFPEMKPHDKLPWKNMGFNDHHQDSFGPPDAPEFLPPIPPRPPHLQHLSHKEYIQHLLYNLLLNN